MLKEQNESGDEAVNAVESQEGIDVDTETTDGFPQSQDQELIIFRSEGDGEDSMITYAIPISGTEDYDDTGPGAVECQTIIIKDEELLSHEVHQTYQIIDGYLVPTSTNLQHQHLHSNQFTNHNHVQITPPPPVIRKPFPPPVPIPPDSLTPEALRKKSRKHPNKLLRVYHCSFCDSAFEDFRSIKVHEAEHINVGDQVQTNLNSQTNYLGMKMIPQSDSKFTCPYCLKGFDVSADLGQHVRRSHKEARKRKLRPQNKEKVPPQSEVHRATSPITFTCEECAEIFTEYETYTKHRIDHANGCIISMSV